MVYLYNDKKVYYRFCNRKSQRPIVLLHGWGCDSSIFSDLIEREKDRSFLVIDFPPFGKSDKTIEDWNIFTYVGMLMSLCDHLRIDKCDVLGHSFGGRIAIILSAVKRSLVHSCILVDSAGLKPRRNLKYHIKVYRYKLRKALGKSTFNMGSKDYLALSPGMRKTFVSIVNTYLDEYCKKMSVKTLLIWGEKDNDTPLYMAKRMKKYIKNSSLKVINGAGHFCFIDRPLEFYKIVNAFWEEE